jgi:VWFA-related protein
MNPVQKAAVSCVLAALIGGGAGAQDIPAEPTIRITATEVLLDISVRDKQGRLVKNLKPSEVEIYEDGVRQQMLSFRLAEQRRGEQKPGAPAARSLRAVNPVCVVFHNLSPVARTRAIEAVQEFLKSEFPPETYVGLFVLDDRLKPVYPFTKDREELLRAAQNPFSGRTVDFARASEAVLTANPTQVTVATVTDTAARTSTTTVRVTGGEIASTTVPAAEMSTGAGANALRGDQVRERGTFSHISQMRDTDQIVTMIKELAALPGRKSVLFVTTGLVMTSDTERFQSVVEEANRSGLSVYALDARGLDDHSTMQAGNLAVGRVAGVSSTQAAATSSLGAMREKSRQLDNMEDAVRGSDVLASMRALAEGTGGFLIANTNDFRKPFRNIVEDLDTHYEAVYRPASGKYDGQLRKIEVRLARAGLSADGRTGYFAVPDTAAAPAGFETAALAVLNARPLPHAFDFKAAAYHFRRDAKTYQGALAFEVPGAALTATPDPEKKTQRVHVSVLALVKRADGQIVDKFSLDAPYDVPEAELPMVRAGSVAYSHPLNLPPGRYADQ